MKRINKAQTELSTGFTAEFWYIEGQLRLDKLRKFVDRCSSELTCRVSFKPLQPNTSEAHGFDVASFEHHVWFDITPERYKNLHKSYKFEYVYGGIEDMGNAISTFIDTAKFFEKPKPEGRKQKRNDRWSK